MTQALVIDYQDAWPAQYAQVEAELRSVIALPGIVVQHIGSTAVPGLCSKPVLDIVLGVAALDDMGAAAPALAHIGFIYRPEYQLQIPDRRYFVRAEGRAPRVHLHAVIMGGPIWRQHLRFRDALREDQELRQSYAELKRRLAVVHMADKAAYTEAKAPFIRQVLGIPDQRGHPDRG